MFDGSTSAYSKLTNSILKITIDTSVIAEEGSATLGYLVNAHQSETLDVAVASRFKMDKNNDTDPVRVERQRQIVGKLNLVPSGFIIGTDYLNDEMAILIDDELHQQLFCLFDIDTSTRGGMHTRYDVDHIYSHLIRSRDVFLTFEGKFIKKRAVLGEVGINLAHPDKFVEAMRQTSLCYPLHSPEFRQRLCFLLDQIHQAPMNMQLLKQLQAMREAQSYIKAGQYTKEDEKVIRYIAANFKSYNHKPLQIAVILIKQHYHDMKNVYLSRYPSQPITVKNIVHGLKEIYGHVLDREAT